MLHRRNASAVTTISHMNRKIHLLFIVLIINILINAVIAHYGRAEAQKSRLRRFFFKNPEVCKVEFERGSCYDCPACLANLTWKYYYSKNEDDCLPFLFYVNCEVNENNFDSFKQCERTCVRDPTPQYF